MATEKDDNSFSRLFIRKDDSFRWEGELNRLAAIMILVVVAHNLLLLSASLYAREGRDILAGSTFSLLSLFMLYLHITKRYILSKFLLALLVPFALLFSLTRFGLHPDNLAFLILPFIAIPFILFNRPANLALLVLSVSVYLLVVLFGGLLNFYHSSDLFDTRLAEATLLEDLPLKLVLFALLAVVFRYISLLLARSERRSANLSAALMETRESLRIGAVKCQEQKKELLDKLQLLEKRTMQSIVTKMNYIEPNSPISKP
ncbi:MAG: hypothetical protein HC819_24070 [Cyclobacteriaceae bacterium]|nr:hypothetical protein [Cyclobacteriaceae bacterium]